MMTVIALIFFFLLVFVYFYYRQDNMLFFPEKVIWRTPKSIGLEFEEVRLTTKDNVVIAGWYIPAWRLSWRSAGRYPSRYERL